jgi:hypothetical protein
VSVSKRDHEGLYTIFLLLVNSATDKTIITIKIDTGVNNTNLSTDLEMVKSLIEFLATL